MGSAGLPAAAGAAMALSGLLPYPRKRRQVAEHYAMGEGESGREAGAVTVFGSAGTIRS
jgi:hypothetical protein